MGKINVNLGLATLSWAIFIVIATMAKTDHLVWPTHVSCAGFNRTMQEMSPSSPFTREVSDKWLLLALIINMVSILFWIVPVVIYAKANNKTKGEEAHELKFAEDLSMCGYFL